MPGSQGSDVRRPAVGGWEPGAGAWADGARGWVPGAGAWADAARGWVPGAGAWAAGARRWAGRARVWLGRCWKGHRLVITVAALALVPRLLAELAFRPALLTPDSFGYLAEGVHPTPGEWHPAGYPVMLRLAEPFHSLLLVTGVQHLMGVAAGVTGYAVLRHWGLPAWGAVLAACPTLFDSRQIALESSILPDTLYALLLTLSVALLLTRRGPTAGRCALAGVLLAGGAITRGNGAAELAALLAVLLVQRAGWRSATAAALAFTLPLLGYMGLFAARYGDFALTNSDGMFLWSRTMSFANCAVIEPPAALRPLCPDRQPGHPARATPAWSVPALLAARTPADYLWAPGVWWRHGPHPGFTSGNNALAMRFALAAIRAQPGAYLRTVGSGVMLTFLSTDRSLGVRALHFTAVPDVPRLYRRERRHLLEYGHTTTGTHAVAPYAYFLYLYQEPVYFTGLMFGAVVAAGLAGVIMRWRRRGGLPALPWAVAAVGIVFPVAVHEYHYRYVISVVPAACLAAGLAFVRRPAPPPRAEEPGAVRPLAGAIPAPALPPGAVPAPTPPAILNQGSDLRG